MAEQFVLKGVNRLEDYKSDSGTFTFRIKNDPRGGDTWQLPQWWAKKANNTVYQSCTVIELVNTNYLLAIPTSADTQLMVTYDDDVYNIGFSNFDSVDRIAVTSRDNKKIVVEYLLPSVSGGAIAKRILQPPATIGDFDVSGENAVDTGSSEPYSVNATPDSPNPVYLWEVTESGSVVASSKAEVTGGQGTADCTVNWKQAGSYGVRCTISDDDADDSPQDRSLAVTCTAADTVGTATISTGPATIEAGLSGNYAVTVSGNTVSDLSYQWNVLNADAQIGTPNAADTDITFEKEGNATVQCIVSSTHAPDSDTATKSVDVTTARKIGTVTVNGPSTTEATVAANFQAQISGNIVDATYLWIASPSDGTVVINDANAEATNMTFKATGDYEIRCTVSSATAQDSSQTNADPADISVTPLDGIVGVSLGGPQDVATLNIGKNYTSKVSDDSTLAGDTTYLWTATDADTGETTGIGVVFQTPDAQDTQVTFTDKADGRAVQLRCKWTNNAYTTPQKTGMRTVNIDSNGEGV